MTYDVKRGTLCRCTSVLNQKYLIFCLAPRKIARVPHHSGHLWSSLFQKYFYSFSIVMSNVEKPRFPISSGAPCASASLFTSVQHCLEMLVHYIVTLSYKPVQTTSLHIRRSVFYNDMRFVLSQSPNSTTPLGI